MQEFTESERYLVLTALWNYQTTMTQLQAEHTEEEALPVAIHAARRTQGSGRKARRRPGPSNLRLGRARHDAVGLRARRYPFAATRTRRDSPGRRRSDPRARSGASRRSSSRRGSQILLPVSLNLPRSLRAHHRVRPPLCVPWIAPRLGS